ncbi:MAG: tol-pal system protein YbgF [Gammaproteobacteria bacterium]|nr:MAG: tol-pal system protein YbgF [Gammaproteobacteria bacterium]
MRIKAPVCFLSAITLSVAATVIHAETVDERLLRLERLVNSQVLIEQSQQMEQIRQELAQLRELLENQEHEMNLIKQRQRNLYQDMDRRLHDLEVGGSSTPNSASAPVNPPVIAAPNSASSVAPPGAAVALASNTMPEEQDDADGKLAYSKAFNLLKEGRYQQAIIDFRNFISRYPDSKYTANAQYWLAEANYVSRDYPAALAEFQKILKNYPDSNKIQGAELKIGYTYYEMKDWATARMTLESVMQRYPNTSVAKKAEERLQRMKREGR